MLYYFNGSMWWVRWYIIEFKTSKRIDKWVEKHIKQGCVSRATAGEQFVYEFLPIGIVTVITVKCMCCKKRIYWLCRLAKERNIYG